MSIATAVRAEFPDGEEDPLVQLLELLAVTLDEGGTDSLDRLIPRFLLVLEAMDRRRAILAHVPEKDVVPYWDPRAVPPTVGNSQKPARAHSGASGRVPGR